MKKLTFDQIENLIENFDFETIHAYMIINKWTWGGPGDNNKTPSIERMKETCHFLLHKIQDAQDKGNFSTSVATGGFWAYSFEYGVQLSFNISKTSTF